MSRYYDRQGNPLGDDPAKIVWPDDSERRVAKNEPFPGVLVLTVFLALNHQYGDGPPLIFETMVFVEGPTASGWDEFCERYSTETQALAGHNAIYAAIVAGADPATFVLPAVTE